MVTHMDNASLLFWIVKSTERHHAQHPKNYYTKPSSIWQKICSRNYEIEIQMPSKECYDQICRLYSKQIMELSWQNGLIETDLKFFLKWLQYL